MTCHDARERFSELVDERLAGPNRVAVDAHLVECAACRAELDAFRATVTLVRSLGPVRAPANFAERVIAAARQPQPMRAPRQRLIDRLLFPLPVKLPLQAAAVMLVGVGVAYLFHHTPELQQATRVEPPAVTEQRPAPAAPPVPVEPSRPAVPAESFAPPPVSELRASDARERDQLSAPADEPVKAKRDAPEPGRKAETPVSTVEPQRSEAPAQAPGVGSMAPREPAQEAPQQRVLRDRAREKEAPPAAAPPRILSTGELSRRAIAKTVAPPDVSGALTVASRATAESALRELVTRHRGQILERTADASATTIDVLVPRATVTAFVADLETLGRWRVDLPATSVPDDVRITVRLSE